MPKLSVIIPSRSEPYLNRTIEDVLEKATGSIDIHVILDGYQPIDLLEDERVHSIHIPFDDGKCHLRQGINTIVKMTDADYVMKLDAHCLVAKGFDEQLIRDHKPNWVQVPRRVRLDVEKWEVIEDGRPPVDYEFIIFRNLFERVGESRGFLWGTPWDDLTKERMDIMIDDTPHFQGSCWFMSKDWFIKNKFMDLAYTGWGQESEELTFETIKNGGEVKVNKNTYYAHLHKGMEARKWFTLPEDELAKSYIYSYNRWVIENKELFIKFIDKFPPMPGWPAAWKRII